MTQKLSSWHLALGLLMLIAAVPVEAQQTASQWIWFPESAPNDCIRESRWLRKSFDLPADVKSADLWLLVDDGHALWVNGAALSDPVERRGSSCRYALTELLRPGRNVIAIEAYNAGGPAGVIARLLITLDNDEGLVINSDESWRAAKTEQEGWNQPGFDDAEWPRAKIVGSAFKAPWIGIPGYHMNVFITAEEATAHARWRETLMATGEQFAAEEPAHAALRPHNGAPALFINGEPRPVVMYRGSIDPLDDHGRRQIANFRDAGVHLFCPYVRIDKCWPDPGEYDFSSVDEQIRAYLSVDPDAHLMLLVRLIPPNWWMEQHPTEWVAYATSDQLDSSDEARRCKRASPASEAWLRDTGEAWRALIQHLEAQPWGKRVIGYHACYGIYAEWHYFGSWTDQYPDTGAAMTRTFREWLRGKYESVADLRQAWNDAEVTFDTVQVPGVEPRKTSQLIAFRKPAQERRVIDYYHCQQQVIADDIEFFGRIAKQETQEHALYGVYYGYFFGVRPQTQGGHLQLERLFRSPYVDYFVAPYAYSYRLMGQDGRLRSLAAAFNYAGKTHILEGDIRTYLHPRNEHGRTANLMESLAAIRREFTTALTEHTGFWFVDFGPEGQGGWFDEPHIMAEAANLQELATRAVSIPRQPAAEIALVCDLESGYYLSDGDGMTIAHRLVEEVGTEMYHLGAPFDALLLSQLAEADLSRYRLLVFLNVAQMTEQQAAEIEELRAGGEHAMVFLWAPGLCDPGGISVERVSRITGLDLELLESWLPAVVEVTGADDPLTRDLPRSQVFTINPTGSAPVPAFGETENWHNPRDAMTMEKHYKLYDVAAIEGGASWSFDTSYSWTDIHFHAPIPDGNGIGFGLKLTGECSRLSFKCVVKDADWAEFVTPEEVIVAGDWRNFEYPLAAFDNAPWAKQKPEKIALPLQGMKFVLGSTANVGLCEVQLRNLRSLAGEVAPRSVCAFGKGMFGPGLVSRGARGRVLGRVSGTTYPGLVASGKGRATSVFCAAPFVPRELLANLMREAGVHRYLDTTDDVVRADSHCLVIHTEQGGARNLRLPRECLVTDALTREEVGQGKALPIQLPPTSTTVLELRPLP